MGKSCQAYDNCQENSDSYNPMMIYELKLVFDLNEPQFNLYKGNCIISSLYFNSLYMLKTQGYHPAGIECNPNSNNTISSSCASNVTNVKWLPDS
ncbi:hypothetical protein RIR_jg29293.t1 [Rhizophagus irregularis DAOM 181602=DAOM 197198]|nr:hypothetical protein RIR_jg29293.t1 [Rhizophagus irregularis DAOM 181602=DAOM 197198]